MTAGEGGGGEEGGMEADVAKGKSRGWLWRKREMGRKEKGREKEI